MGQADGEIVDVFEMKPSEVVRMIRGPRGSTVRLRVKPQDGGETKIIVLTRREVAIKDSVGDSPMSEDQQRGSRRCRRTTEVEPFAEEGGTRRVRSSLS